EVGGYKCSFTLDWQVSEVFRLFLIDQNIENYCVLDQNKDIMGKERRFNGLKHVWGFDKFIPLRAFNDASNGYLVEDTCVFEAEVLVKERNKFKEISIICKCISKIENFSKLDAGYEESQEDRDTPMGAGPDAGDYLSLFLVFGDSTVRSTVKNSNNVYNETDSFSLGGRERFHAPGDNKWGWSRFVSLSKLYDPENGYLVNDVCVVEAEITVIRISEAL
ncbi:hypothetical protein CUMW_179970, partial [Citrus unshiu]